jgi:hypothetical protein
MRVSAIAFLWAGIELLFVKAGGALASWPRDVGFAAVGLLWSFALTRRLQDTGLPRWYLLPYAALVISACVLPVVLWAADRSLCPLVFVVVQIPTLFIRRGTGGPEGH